MGSAGTAPTLGRRQLLAGAAALATATTVGCSVRPNDTPPPSITGRAALPTFVAYQGADPDLPALNNGTAAYFARIPTEPARFLSGKPGSGGTVEAFTILNAAMTPVDRNPHWQAVNALLGVDLQMTGAPIGDVGKKFVTLTAGNQLPDITCVLPSAVPQLAGLLDAKFADLSEHLSGDAIKDYPALANIPTYNWAGSYFNQRIQLIPSPRFALYRTYLVRGDLAEKAGIDPEPKSGAELAELLAAFTNPAKKQVATISARGLLDMVCEMMGTPNSWSVDDGKFTRMYEDPTYPEALAFVAKAWQRKQIHPEAFSPSLSTNATAMYAAGQSPLFPATAAFASVAIAAKDATPTALTQPIKLHAWDGGTTAVERWLGPGTFYFIGIPKTDPGRVRELLGVINALASPFGTAEYMTIKYGRRDLDYTVHDGVVTPTDEGKANQMQPITYLGGAAPVHFATDPAIAKDEYEAEAAAMDHAIARPTTGLTSDTNDSKGSQLDRVMIDAVTGIITGRTKVSEWPTIVGNWRSKGGDAIRREYEAAYAQAQ